MHQILHRGIKIQLSVYIFGQYPLPTLNWAVQMPLEAGIIEKKKHLPLKNTTIMQD